VSPPKWVSRRTVSVCLPGPPFRRAQQSAVFLGNEVFLAKMMDAGGKKKYTFFDEIST